MYRAVIRAVVALFVAFVAATPVVAQTWTGGAGNGNWNAAGNWNSGLPPTNGTAAIVLGGTTQTTTIQNLANPLPLNSLTLADTATSGFVVNGSPLSFTGTGAQIVTQVSGTSPAILRVNAPVTFAANTLLDIQGNITAANNGAELNLAGPLTAAPGTVVTANGGIGTIIILSGRNNAGFQGTLAFQANSQVGVFLGADNAIGRQTIVNTTGASSLGTGVRVGVTSVAGPADLGVGVQIARLVGSNATNNSGFNVGAGTTTAAALVGFDNQDSTFNGAISLNGNADNRNTYFGKVGTGTLTLGGNSGTGFGTYAVRDGSIVLSGANGRLSSASAELSIYAGGTIRADNTASNQQDRLPGSGTTAGDRAIVLSGGTLWLTGNGTANTSEIASGLRLQSGQSTVLVDGVVTDRAHRFNFNATGAAGGLAQQNSTTATVFFRSTNLGQQSSTTGSNVGGMAFATAPTLTGGGGAAGTTNVSIIPFGFGTGATSPSTTTIAESFVTYSTTNNSIRSLTDAEYASAFGTATDNVSLGAATSLTGAATANAVRLTSGGSIALGANNLTVTSGAVLNNGGGNVTGTGTVNFGAAGATTAYLTTNGAMTISAPISATNLSKNGAGTLTLGGAVTLGTGAANGVVAVNAGTLDIGGATFTNARVFQVSRGATLSGGLTVGNNQTLTGAGSVLGNVTVNSGGTITPSALGGPGADLASPGTLALSPAGGGALTLNGGSNYRWYVSSAVTDGDNTVAPTAGTLNNFKSPYTAGLLTVSGNLDLSGASSSNRINILVTSLALSNAAGPVYDLDKLTDTRSWVIAETTGGGQILGFSPDKFNLNVSGFANLQPGDPNTLAISQVGNALVLTFTPVPEPTTVLGIAALALGVGARVRRKRATAAD